MIERLAEALHIALANLLSNVVRSTLSILGIVIGIAAVITVMALGSGARQQIVERLSAMGLDIFYVQGVYDSDSGRVGQIDLIDLERLQKLPFVVSAVPQLNEYRSLRSRTVADRGIVRGVTPSYIEARRLILTSGRNFTPLEDEERRTVCLISMAAAAKFFPTDPMGQTLFIDADPWTVIGTYTAAEKRPGSGLPGGDVEILTPLSSMMRRSKDLFVQNVEVHARPGSGPSEASQLLQSLERDDPKRKGLFSVRDPRELYARSMELQRTLSMIGVLVAGVSLIVGGIGMMNVMLTSVAERTREIGIRRAVGARKKDILFQFLVESCVLSAMGGILGLLSGAALARLLPILAADKVQMASRLEPAFVVIAVASGVTLGVVFGLYPAVKASRLSPSEALRSG